MTTTMRVLLAMGLWLLAACGDAMVGEQNCLGTAKACGQMPPQHADYPDAGLRVSTTALAPSDQVLEAVWSIELPSELPGNQLPRQGTTGLLWAPQTPDGPTILPHTPSVGIVGIDPDSGAIVRQVDLPGDAAELVELDARSGEPTIVIKEYVDSELGVVAKAPWVEAWAWPNASFDEPEKTPLQLWPGDVWAPSEALRLANGDTVMAQLGFARVWLVDAEGKTQWGRADLQSSGNTTAGKYATLFETPDGEVLYINYDLGAVDNTVTVAWIRPNGTLREHRQVIAEDDDIDAARFNVAPNGDALIAVLDARSRGMEIFRLRRDGVLVLSHRLDRNTYQDARPLGISDDGKGGLLILGTFGSKDVRQTALCQLKAGDEEAYCRALDADYTSGRTANVYVRGDAVFVQGRSRIARYDLGELRE